MLRILLVLALGAVMPSVAYAAEADLYVQSPASSGPQWQPVSGANPLQVQSAGSPAAAALQDATPNPTTTGSAGFSEIFNGTTWDRQRSAAGTVGVTVVNTEGTKATYDAAQFITGAGGTMNDLCALPGSASKTIRLLSTEIMLASTAAANLTPVVSKRSAASTGTAGTSMTAVPRDSNSAAASAAPVYWPNSSSEVPGAAVGNIATPVYQSVAVSPVAGEPPVDLKFSFGAGDNSSAVVLRGTAQSVAWNFGGISLPAGIVGECRFVWTEE